MKFCTKCGEVYPSDVATCNVDGAVLEMWTRTLFEAKDETKNHDLLDKRLNQLDSDDDSEVTNVEAMPYDNPPQALTSKVSSSDIVNAGVSGNTSVMDMREGVTLTEFDVNSKAAPIDTGDELVVYDDEVGGPFTGMLISNRYRLESRIGTGGFGVVFDAYDREKDTRVAVKVLSPALSEDKRALMRFRREAIAVSRLEHPGIVSISDFGIEDEGVSYIVMEFLPGRDVAALLEDERYLSARRAATLVMQCAEALTAAHDEGVLHRDLKPANIFVIQTKDLVERIKIIDFGIAKDRSSNPRMKDITAASKVVGTPFYMSPEQASGVELDGRADVYSLGVILYELLTGQRPFEGPSVYDILVAHGKAKRVKPSSVREELRSEGTLDEIVLQAIAPRRDDRFQSMDAFAEALRGYLESAEGHASASSLRFDASLEGVRPSRGTMMESSGQIRRHSRIRQKRIPWAWMIGFAAFVVLAGVFFFAYQEWQGAQPPNASQGVTPPSSPQSPVVAPAAVQYEQVDRNLLADAGPPDAEAEAEAEAEEPLLTPAERRRARIEERKRLANPAVKVETPKPEVTPGSDASPTVDESETKSGKIKRKPKWKPKPKPKPKTDAPPKVDAPIRERGIEDW